MIFTGESYRASCQSEASEQEPQEPLKVGCLVLGRVVNNPYPSSKLTLEVLGHHFFMGCFMNHHFL